MKVFLIKLSLFFILALTVLFGVTKLLSLRIEKKYFANYDSDANLFTIKRDQHFNIMFMGISHARNFTRYKNQLRVEKILHLSTINIGRGGGKCGVEAEYIYLEHFFSRGNTVDNVIYVPTPPMMFSEYLDINSSIFEHEPFRISFFFQYLFSRAKNKKQQLYYYLRSKYTRQWANFGPFSLDSNDHSLPKYDPAAIRHGFTLAYPKGLDKVTFNRNKKIIIKTIKLCQRHHTHVIFLMTPAIFGKWPGDDQVFHFLHKLQHTYPIEVYDYSDVCHDRKLYLDHHHLNSRGVSWFTKKYIKPIMDKDYNR